MSRTHCVSLKRMPDTWEGLNVQALCGQVVINARPVFRLNFQTLEVKSLNTLAFCAICFPLAMLPVDGREYIAGILPAEEALKLNGVSDEE